MEQYSLLIHTRNNRDKLERLLGSIVANKFLNKLPVLIIDDSSTSEFLSLNFNLISKLKDLNIIYINSNEWEKLKAKIANTLKNKELIAILKSIVLGKSSWNTHNTRNVGQIISNILFDKNTVLLNLDDDMVFPKYFNFKGFNKKVLCGVKLDGCPDLSRLEWIRLYLNLIAKNKKINLDLKKGYEEKIVNSLTEENLKHIVQKYTTLKIKDAKELHKLVRFQYREELNGGAYLSPADNANISMFPPWFDEDWYWFFKLRKVKKSSLIFLNKKITHNSDKKNILNKEILQFEEIGKVLTEALKDKEDYSLPKYEEIEKIVNKRELILKEIILIAKNLIKIIRDVETKKELINIIKTVEDLIAFITSKSKKFFIEESRKFFLNQKSWPLLINNIRKQNKNLIYFLLKNKFKKTIILSPHCDDAVFCLGGAIINNFFKNIKIYNFFTLTNYTIWGVGDTKKIKKIREEEEKNVMSKLGLDSISFNYRDAVIRGYKEEADYLNKDNLPKKDFIFKSISLKIRKLVRGDKNSLILVPLGLGNHIDHKIINEIGKELLKEGYSVLFYEDIPYEDNKDSLKMKMLTKGLIPINLNFSNLNDKLNVVKLYKSQVDLPTMQLIREIGVLRCGERIWINSNNKIMDGF